MSWFKKPVEYRSYSDGSYEIIERRSLLRIGAAALGLLGVAGGTAAVVMTKSPMGGNSGQQLSRPPELTQQLVARILEAQDRDALYRILGHYDSLDPVEKGEFWRLATAFKCGELRPFAEQALQSENHPLVKPRIDFFLQGIR